MFPRPPSLLPLSVALLCTVAGGAARAQADEGNGALAASLREQAIAYEHGEGVARDARRAADL